MCNDLVTFPDFQDGKIFLQPENNEADAFYGAEIMQYTSYVNEVRSMSLGMMLYIPLGL